MTQFRRLFTIEEINAVLPKVESVLASLVENKENLDNLHDQLLMHELLVQDGPLGPYYNPGKVLEREAVDLDHSVENRFKKELDQLRGIGCIIRDLEKGWVDFPGTFQGETVCFCWKRGEKTVQYFHLLEEGTEKRRPIHS